MKYLWENYFKADRSALTIKSSLKDNILFKNLSSREIKIVEEIIHERHYRTGEVVFRQGEIGVGMYIIVKGAVDITVSDRDDEEPGQHKEILVTRLTQNDFFGELSLVEDNGRRSATATASADSVLIGFFKPDLLTILESTPVTGVKVVFRLAEVLGRRLKETSEKIKQLKIEVRALEENPNQSKGKDLGAKTTPFTS